MNLFDYFRAYYMLNRTTWPELSRRAAAKDAFKLAWKVWWLIERD